MNRMMVSVACFGMVALVGARAGEGKGISIDGTWVMVRVVSKGEKIPDADVAKLMATGVFKDGKYSFAVMGKVQETGTFKIDAAKQPPTIDMVPADGKDKGKTEPGILKLDGDTLTIAVADAGSATRPKTFEPAKDVEIQVYKKRK
jgi:uncharacterized protein (TIGR03067 family)